ncbi:MAG: DnaD domain protein [Firmicutes bacterium]|nr:DnaD domain protein [Bacillota bacterium]
MALQDSWRGHLKESILIRGTFSVPNVIIDHFFQAGLEAEDLPLVLHLVRSQDEDLRVQLTRTFISVTRKLFPDFEAGLDKFRKKKIIELLRGPGTDQDHLDLLPFYDRILEQWGRECVSPIENTPSRTLARSASLSPSRGDRLIESFVAEFPRGLSPLEYQSVNRWREEGFPDEVILEALEEAIVRDKRSLKYIDRILVSWQQRGLQTVQEVRAYREEARQMGPSGGYQHGYPPFVKAGAGKQSLSSRGPAGDSGRKGPDKRPGPAAKNGSQVGNGKAGGDRPAGSPAGRKKRYESVYE